MSSTSAEILEAKIERMGRELRASDLVSGVLRTLLGVLSILFLAVLAEQCLTQHGLGPVTRWLVSLLVYSVGGALLVVQVLHVIRHRINPVYAAALIEDAEPGLKNSLISWVYLRRRHGRDPVSSRVFESLESHTAETLTTTENSVVVDRHHLIQLGVALGVLLTLLCVYIVVSPKNPIVTFARILLPWADIDAPTRVQISEVRPGDAMCTMGETFVISATVQGLREDEEPQVRLDTMDGRIQGQLVPMRRDKKAAFGYTATVPPGSEGTQQDFIYTVIAGDTQSSRFDVKMQIPMLAEVTAVTYDYPAFTGQLTQRMIGSGNIHAPESTKLEIEVHANRSLAKATLIPDGLSVTPIPLAISKENAQNAKGTWILEADPEHPERPRYAAYRLQVQDTSGNRNANPPSYRITMIPNRLPKIEWIEPPEEGISIPINQELTLSLTANDPDYGLKEVTITLEKDGKVFAEETLWQDTQNKTNTTVVHEKTVASSFSFRGDRAAWKLRPGDRIAYRASCRDLRGVPLAQPTQTETRSFILEQPNQNATKKLEEKKTVKNPTNSTMTAEDHLTSDADTTGDVDNIDNTDNTNTTKTADHTSAVDTSDAAQPPANETASDMSTDRASEKPLKNTSDTVSQDSANASETTESAESTSDVSQNSQEGSSSKDSNSTDTAERSSTEPSSSGEDTYKDVQKNASEQKNSSGKNNSSKGDGNSGENGNAAQNGKSEQQNEVGNDTENGESQTAGSSASASSDSSRQNGENGENDENKNGNRSETSNASDSRKQERIDSQTSPGDAMERILEYAKQQSEKPSDSPSDTQSRQPSEHTDPQPEKQPSDSDQNLSDAASSSDSQSSENSQKNSGNKKDGKSSGNNKNNENKENKKSGKNNQTENASPNEPSVENSSEKASPNTSDSQKDSSDSQNSSSQDQTSSDQISSGKSSDGNTSEEAPKGESGKSTNDEMSSNASQPNTSPSDSSQLGSPSDSSQPYAAQGDTPQSGTPSGNDSANSSEQSSSSKNPSQNADSPQNNASSNHPSDGTQVPNAADTGATTSSEGTLSNGTTDNKSSESSNTFQPSPEMSDTDAISDSGEPGDPRTARAAAKGTDPKDAGRSDDPALRRAAQEAVQQGAETLRSTDPVLQSRDETLSTNRPYGSDQTDPTTSDTPVRPGDPLAQQALHPETPNRQAIQHSPDAMSGDGRESGGTRPTERPQPVNAAGNDFRNATPDGTGRTGTQADEDGTQSVTTNQLSATTSESPNGRPGQKMQATDSQTNTQKQPFSNVSATENAQNAQNDPNPLGKMGQLDHMQGMSGHESSGSSRKSNPSAEESANAPRGDSRESGAGYQNPENMNPAEDGSRETGADQARADFTRQNTQLALQTLEEALKRQDTTLLDQLGWSRAEAEAFLRQWKQIAAVAGESTQEGEDAKKSLKSLGLSAQNATTRRTVPGQKARQLRQTSTIEAPAEWNEWFQAYRRSVGQTPSKPNPTPNH